MEAHLWYTLNTPLDWVRAILWTVSNLATGIAYFAIPYEIWQWRAQLTFISANIIAALFVAFILLCGESHFAMVLIMQTGPWWAIILVYVPMAVVSVATARVLHKERNQIIQVLKSLTRILQNGSN